MSLASPDVTKHNHGGAWWLLAGGWLIAVPLTGDNVEGAVRTMCLCFDTEAFYPSETFAVFSTCRDGLCGSHAESFEMMIS